MKILSNKEYRELLNKSLEGGPLEKTLRDRIEELNKNNLNLIEDHKILLARKDLEVQNKIDKKTEELSKLVTSLTIEKNNLQKEAEILTKAFQNLGFDVKDMKEILNKLVDGIVSKNSIQLVK